MSNNNSHSKTENNFQQPKPSENKQSLKNVRQDNSRFSSARLASRQPAPDTKCDRALSLNNAIVCSHFPNSQQNRTVKLTTWVKPIVKDKIERLAKREKLSLSAATAFYLERAVQLDTDLQYTALLEPVIVKTIDKHMRSFKTENTHLLVRIAYDVGQIRALVANILRHLPGMTHDIFRGIVANSEITAKGNIARLTPQIKEMIAKVKERFLAQEGDKEPS